MKQSEIGIISQNQRTIGPVNAHLKLPMLLFRHWNVCFSKLITSTWGRERADIPTIVYFNGAFFCFLFGLIIAIVVCCQGCKTKSEFSALTHLTSDSGISPIGQGQPRGIFWTKCVLKPKWNIPSQNVIGPFISREVYLRVFTIYGCNSQLGHVT